MMDKKDFLFLSLMMFGVFSIGYMYVGSIIFFEIKPNEYADFFHYAKIHPDLIDDILDDDIVTHWERRCFFERLHKKQKLSDIREIEALHVK